MTGCIEHELDNNESALDPSSATEVIKVDPQRALSQQATYVKNGHKACNKHSEQINGFKRKQVWLRHHNYLENENYGTVSFDVLYAILFVNK